jgi:peptidoglycan hydrolase-like protein with peptidoglycan-binding domain
MTNPNNTIPSSGVPTTSASEAVTKVETTVPVVLHVTTPLLRGAQILDVQRKLYFLGFLKGDSNSDFDSIYGPSTEAAVRSFQSSKGLEADGIVGPITLAVLTAEVPLGNQASPSLSSTSGLQAEGVAEKFVGLKESPPGSNRTTFGVWYGHDGLPWCAIFVSYCFSQGANKILCDGYLGPGVKVGKGCAYVPTVEDWLKATGQWLGKTNPCRSGDIVIFNFEGKGPDHIGIVVNATGSGEIMTIEGNTSGGNNSNGGEVMFRTRRLAQIEGFGRVKP